MNLWVFGEGIERERIRELRGVPCIQEKRMKEKVGENERDKLCAKSLVKKRKRKKKDTSDLMKKKVIALARNAPCFETAFLIEKRKKKKSSPKSEKRGFLRSSFQWPLHDKK